LERARNQILPGSGRKSDGGMDRVPTDARWDRQARGIVVVESDHEQSANEIADKDRGLRVSQ
jgi:hypothetical protein